MRRRCGRLRCRRVDNALLIHRYGPPANTTLKDAKKGDRFIFCCRLAGPPPPPRFPWSHRQVSPCTASHFLLPGQEKVTKEKATPASGSGLRPDFPRSGAAPGAGLQGPSLALYAGAPSPLAASMRLVPLRNTSTRPPDRDRSPSRPEVRASLVWFFCRVSSDTNRPFRRVSGIAVEGVERHGCRESRDGPGTALRGVPLEWRWSERTRSEAQGRMQGQALLVPFGATAKRNPPSRAEQKARHLQPQPLCNTSTWRQQENKSELKGNTNRPPFNRHTNIN